jgi:hypothetical protein
VDRRIRPSGTRPTPGRFATRVVTRGIDPHLQIHYKASKVKAYFKEQRALRVETTINDPGDFGVGRRLTGDNWRALQAIGEQTNARFLAALGEGAPTPPDQTTLTEVVLPSATDDGLQAPGLRFGDPRVMALFAVLASFAHLVGGLTNAGLCQLMGGCSTPPTPPARPPTTCAGCAARASSMADAWQQPGRLGRVPADVATATSG